MATIYKQISEYCKKSKKPIPPLETRKQIGEKVVQAWFNESNVLNKFFALHKVKIVEVDGNTYEVLSYPKLFKPVIDAIIMQSINPHNPSMRKRNKIKPSPKLVFQVKRK